MNPDSSWRSTFSTPWCQILASHNRSVSWARMLLCCLPNNCPWSPTALSKRFSTVWDPASSGLRASWTLWSTNSWVLRRWACSSVGSFSFTCCASHSIVLSFCFPQCNEVSGKELLALQSAAEGLPNCVFKQVKAREILNYTEALKNISKVLSKGQLKAMLQGVSQKKKCKECNIGIVDREQQIDLISNKK